MAWLKWRCQKCGCTFTAEKKPPKCVSCDSTDLVELLRG